MADKSTVLPEGTQIVGQDSIEIEVVKNISEVMLQVLAGVGVTQAQLERHMDFYGQATTSLSIMMLAYIKAAGGDYSRPCPPIKEFGPMVQEIANQNAYCVEYDQG